MFNWLRSFFSSKPQTAKRSYADVAQVGGMNSDWPLSALSQDAEVWQNNFALRQRLRSLFDETPFFRKYQDQLVANVFGDTGIRLRMKVKEEEDRVIYTEAEKSAHVLHSERIERIATHVARKLGKPLTRDIINQRFGETFRAAIHVHGDDRAKGTIKAGALDLFANQLIERRYNEWKRAEFCTVTGKLHYDEVCRLRIIAIARDGDFFIRKIRDPKINKFGFSLQLIHSEWCDYGLNVPRKGDSNEIRMGVELNQWGKPVAYHFIKRSTNDWMFAPAAGFSMAGIREHERIPAEEIIHYARFDYADSTRPAAWGVAAIPVARHLSKYVEAAVKAARVGACQGGFLESTMVAEGGGLDPNNLPDPCKIANNISVAPGQIIGLPYGVTYKANNPNNPNSNFPGFRKEAMREQCAALPGANYNILANDSEGISYSTGRIFSLDDREMWKILQQFDIEKAERPIFEAWLEMALITGAIPLPLRKFDKFNKPQFSGRRWSWVDPAKDAKALETELANFLTSWSRIMDDRGDDLEEVWLERAEEQMLAEALGLNLPTFGAIPPAEESEEEGEEEEKPPVAGKNPKKEAQAA